MVRWKTLIGTIVLGVVVSSCSTTREELKGSTLEVTTPSSNEGSVIDDRPSTENAVLQNNLQKNTSEIAALRKKIALNDAELSKLNKKLNDQEDKLTRLTLQNAESNATLLQSLENEKAIRSKLEERYLSLKLKNNGLREELDTLMSENTKLANKIIALKAQPDNIKLIESDCSAISTHAEEGVAKTSTVDVVNAVDDGGVESHSVDVAAVDTSTEGCNLVEELSSEYENVLNLQALNDEYAQTVLELEEKQAALTEQYDALNIRHQALDQQHSILKKGNTDLRDAYAKLKQKNFDLGGAIADSRSQHQILWDRISVQDKIIANLQADAQLQSKSPTLQLSHASENYSSANNASLDKSNNGRNIPAVIESSNFVNTLQVESNPLVEENALLTSEIMQLEQAFIEQQALLNKFKAQLHALLQKSEISDDDKEQLAILLRDLEKLSEIDRKIELSLASVRSELDLSKVKESKLNQELEALQAQLPLIRAELESLEQRERTLAAEKLVLEQQINSLIPFEAEVNALENQLKSNIKNVQWQRPTAMPLNSAFEVIVTAEVDNVVSGQVYVAELVVDTSFDLISATEAESTVEDGKLIWRWRISGLNEQRAARVDLFVHQQIQYHDQRFSRQVYRDQTLVTLEDDDFWEEYGFWGLAILAGLFGGFFMGRMGKGK
ncbi:hypothetical protein [Marinomonas sp. 2405UD68-3]|uniref:hypothetical protein n=1 Tax=Marinomonas sp. 2405UD68-3 TaxID=3391835 RepID=UPI0039C9A9E6